MNRNIILLPFLFLELFPPFIFTLDQFKSGTARKLKAAASGKFVNSTVVTYPNNAAKTRKTQQNERPPARRPVRLLLVARTTAIPSSPTPVLRKKGRLLLA
jgi:hypothetical protein